MLVYGKNFRSTLLLGLGGKLVQDLKILSETVAEFVVPSANAQGRLSLSAEQDGVVQAIPVFYLAGAEDLPIITQAVAEVCVGTRYYDRTGAVQTGSKNCTGTVAPPACTADGQVACVSSETFPAASKASLLANKDKFSAALTVAGVSGEVVDCAFDNRTGCITNLDYPSADVRSLDVALLHESMTVGGKTGTMQTCAADNQSGCITDATWKSANPSSFSAWDIRAGKTIAGVAGRIAFYRNGAKLASFNETAVAGSSASTTLVDDYDSVEDDNLGVFPTTFPASGTPAAPELANSRPIKFDSTFDTDSNGACNAAEPCIFKDQMTGLRWYKNSTVGSFANAASACNSLSKGEITNWRVPTQKEIQMAYINGIWAIGQAYGWTNSDYWTATTAAYAPTQAFTMSLSDGTSDKDIKTATSKNIICVKSI